jgi:hypothetical protein
MYVCMYIIYWYILMCEKHVWQMLALVQKSRSQDVTDRSLSFYEKHELPVKRIISGTWPTLTGGLAQQDSRMDTICIVT